MSLLNRVLLAAAMSWGYAVTLGLLFAACASGHFSLGTLRLPGVVPVAIIAGTAVSIAITPVAAWSVRTGLRNLAIYAPVLWVVLAAYEVVAIPRSGAYGPYGLVVLGLVGLAVLGLIPPAKSSLRASKRGVRRA